MIKRISLVLGFLFVFLGLSLVDAAIIFSNSFNSLEEINSGGGIIEGAYEFVSGVEGNAVFLPSTSAVRFSSVNIEDEGTIEFWVKPKFNIKELPRFSTAGLLDIGNFPFTDSFGVWVYRSEYGPVVVLEIKDTYGDYLQAWSNINAFKSEEWHHIALVWSCNKEKHKKNYGRVYVDGKAGEKQKSLCNEIILGDKEVRIGTNGFYPGRTKTIDKLEIYDYIRSSRQIKKDYKNYT